MKNNKESKRNLIFNFWKKLVTREYLFQYSFPNWNSLISKHGNRSQTLTVVHERCHFSYIQVVYLPNQVHQLLRCKDLQNMNAGDFYPCEKQEEYPNWVLNINIFTFVNYFRDSWKSPLHFDQGRVGVLGYRSEWFLRFE